jgi:hypothetical protein
MEFYTHTHTHIQYESSTVIGRMSHTSFCNEKYNSSTWKTTVIKPVINI